MKVHVVIRNPNEKKILPRLASILHEFNGWSVSDRPRRGVDLNYYQIYIDQAEMFSDWKQTLTAAYFSHYEPSSHYRDYWWRLAQTVSSFAICTAKQYGEILKIPYILARAPIEDMFEIREKSNSKLKRVGVSGFAIGGAVARKNVNFVARMGKDLKRAEVVASGHGWPCKIVNKSYDGLPAFYNSLDVYVCTSTIEGVPMPPLEALACGVPIVVPAGVGMLDDLADKPGVAFYQVGNYSDMLAAINGVLKTDFNREALRAGVAEYSPQSWAKDHKDGFERMFKSVKNAQSERQLSTEKRKQIVVSRKIESDAHGNSGVYCVAFGDPARDCACGMIQSLRTHVPDMPVAIVSDKPLECEDVFIHVSDDKDIGGRWAKTKIFELAPRDWEYVCYLDADTEIVSSDLKFLFQPLLDGWDMVICKNPGRFHVATEMRRSDNGRECDYTFREIGTDQLIQLNGGVFAFARNQRTQSFFNAWHDEWNRYGKRDQAALLRALFNNPVKLYVLGNEWNTVTRYDPPERAAAILHYPMTARRWRGVIPGRIDSPEAWKQVKSFKVKV